MSTGDFDGGAVKTQKCLSTRDVAKLLNIKPGRISQAVWSGRIPEPERGPGNAFFWTKPDIERCCRVLLNVGLEERLELLGKHESLRSMEAK